MAFSIKDPATDRAVRDLVEQTGESLTEAVLVAVQERLKRVKSLGRPTLVQEIERIGTRCATRPVLDPRSPDEILGYDEAGLP